MRGERLRVRVAYHARRVFAAIWGFGVVVFFGILLAHGWFPDLRAPETDFVRASAAAVLVAVMVAKIADRLRSSQRRRTPWREAASDVEMGLLLLTATYVFLAAVGGVTSPIHPMVYALVSFLVTFHRLAVGIPLAVAAVALEAAVAFGPGAAAAAAAAFPGHAGFIGIFALLNVAFLHAEVARQRRERHHRLEAEVTSMREEARDFRLISTALPSESRVRTRGEEEEKLSQGSVENIREQLLPTLDLLTVGLHLQTCALLWLDGSGEKLKFKELVSNAPANLLAEGPFSASAGIFGVLIKDGTPIALGQPRIALLPYYQGPAEVTAFVGIPVKEGRSLRGVLICDRKSGEPFSPAEVNLVTAASAQVMRIVQSERVFQAVERSKHEHERFYQASAALNRALTVAEVHDAAIEGARGVCEFDFAALALFEKKAGSFTVARAVGQGAEAIEGRTFNDPTSVAAMVAKNKLALPAGGSWRDHDDAYLFDPSTRMPKFDSLLVLPLLVKDEVIGTFTVAARGSGAFPADRREMLGVVANQVAISLQNAGMVQALEEQATTDGLTGLVNHRTFQERFSAMLGRADRLKFSVAILLTDIDHFKKVNDNYGHPTGDEVLRRVAAILKANARKIDICARYGGEEFAIVLEATDQAGARQLAERVRQEIGQQAFESSKGPFKATLSLGVAVYPQDAQIKAELIARADQSLYAAKHGGRNRTVCFADMKGEVKKEKVLLAAAG